MKTSALENHSPVSSAAEHGAGDKASAQFAAVAQFVKIGGDVTLNFACNQQIDTNLCWAAVTEAVTGVSQNNLKNTYTGGKNVVNDPKQALQDYGKYDGEKGGKIPWNEMVEELKVGPLILLIGPKKDAHYILLIGYKGNSNRDPNRIYRVSDPLNGGTEDWTVSDFDKHTHQGRYYIK